MAYSTIPPWRMRIKQEAEKWANNVVGGLNSANELVGWEVLLDIYKRAGDTETSVVPAWTNEILDGVRHGRWILRQGRFEPKTRTTYWTSTSDDGTIAWCGVFATWLLKTKLHYDVSWRGGMQGSDIQKMGNSVPRGPLNWRDSIDVGDVCVLGDNQHHVIITEVTDGLERVETVEGNLTSPLQSIQKRTDKKKSQFHTLYKISDL